MRDSRRLEIAKSLKDDGHHVYAEDSRSKLSASPPPDLLMLHVGDQQDAHETDGWSVSKILAENVSRCFVIGYAGGGPGAGARSFRHRKYGPLKKYVSRNRLD